MISPSHLCHNAQPARLHDVDASSLVRLCRDLQLARAQRAREVRIIPESLRRHRGGGTDVLPSASRWNLFAGPACHRSFGLEGRAGTESAQVLRSVEARRDVYRLRARGNDRLARVWCKCARRLDHSRATEASETIERVLICLRRECRGDRKGLLIKKKK